MAPISSVSCGRTISPKRPRKGESSGDTTDNIGEAYSDAHFVELYYPSFSPKYQGMDWESLRVVFEDTRNVDGGSTFWLVGIIHGQWTI